MEVITLGTGCALPHPERSAPSHAVKIDETLILLDCGSGTLQRLVQAGEDPFKVSWILLSHLHPDHNTDLVAFLFARRCPDIPKCEDLIIVGPKGFLKFFSYLQKAYGEWIASEKYNLGITEVETKDWIFKNIHFYSQYVPHIPNSLCYKIEANGKSIIYSGDTDYCEEIITLAHKAELALLECSFPNEKKVRGHLTPELAAKIASKAKVKRLCLVHRYPICDRIDIKKQCQEIYKHEIIVPTDLTRIKL
jgi:ribonuclease BN (tRNA processing enzyme)